VKVSCITAEGLDLWMNWIEKQRQAAKLGVAESIV
jgi:hypothetical protein